ncbi:amino acid ABC transporter permease [Nocardioides sp. GY 10113]|uniref:amino acid ABC transporter permease n=1 Tax=Nocardioides sp. GY 10113 TaxID=2569761 RepID=UPI0010A79D0E|nr:amino acid ABC transporter permease [Nocardioides sp. GY 10113]TIC85950.1 amino acid ABC transporter permease [Nocardioides sp. GY 10113]
MSTTNVLFDTPGPRARARHRIYTVVGTLVLLAILAVMIWRLAAENQFEYRKWEPFVSPVYLEAFLVDGVLETVKMAFSAIILAVVFGTLLGVGKLSEHAVVRWPCWAVVEFWRAVPVLLAMVLIFYAWGIDRGYTGAYWSVVFALMLYNGAVLAEVFRAGINAVPKGQVEAAYALGMRKTQVMVTIQLPQAVKIMLPALISQCVVALKDTSLGYAVAAPGLTAVAKLIYSDPDFGQNHIPVVLVTAATYVVLNLILTWVATWVQRRFVGEKRIDVPAVGAGDQD